MYEMKLTNGLLRRATRIAGQMSDIQGELTQAFEARYGTTYSAVDCDQLIEVLDYNGGIPPTVEDADRWMAECGAPPIKDTTNG